MKSKITNFLLCLTILTTTIIVFINSNSVSISFSETILFILKVILPSLFPFMIFVNFILLSNCIDYLAKILAPIGKIFKISGYGIICIIASIIGGFPYNAVLVSQFVKNNKINLKEGKKLAYTMCFPSISFLNSLYSLDRNIVICIISLYIASFVSLYFLGFNKSLSSDYKSLNKITINTNNDFDSLYFNVMQSSVKSIISISFSILFFNLITNILSIYINNTFFINIISGILEFSKTSINLLSRKNKSFIDYLVLNIILSFTSFSIIFQSSYYLKDIKIQTKKLLISRLTISLISTIIFFIIYIIYSHN